jgi:hypothetical protein
MRIYNSCLITLLSLLALSACSSNQKPQLEGFNSELWKNDKKGCEGKRSILAEAVLANSIKLKGMDDDDVADFLGKPEKSNWEERGKKTYYYYIQPGSQCNSDLMLEGSKLAVEFDALGRVKMITEQRF